MNVLVLWRGLALVKWCERIGKATGFTDMRVIGKGPGLLLPIGVITRTRDPYSWLTDSYSVLVQGFFTALQQRR